MSEDWSSCLVSHAYSGHFQCYLSHVSVPNLKSLRPLKVEFMGQRSCRLFYNAIRENELVVDILLPTNMAASILTFLQEFFSRGQNLLLYKFLVLCKFSYCFQTKFFWGGSKPLQGAPLVEESQNINVRRFSKF